ncbi:MULTISPECIES: universal stress protein [Gordonia]|uniref:Universal stress protein n=1 Tax=Gordonia hongkongensis TaxID=1701090 RepID=A0ABT6BQP4_9ACTN|nr:MULTISPECIES: universal stress protein [Gordonia]MCZ4537112.1 universal stress protein [Gordonia terrae]KSU58610.1 universal stress protein UspA [Gordonia sp. SGD-V-85]MBR7190976.1 universal stress protein [Gordonia sp. SCSIO 19800]MCT1355088.1 universal stress protein [Gordonia sp. p3-SID1431]MCX2753043.1 universal stress protein [Gordonia sp. 4N]
MNAILVGVDGSDAATGAVRWAARAAAAEGLDLKVVGAYDASTSDYAPGLIIPQDVVDAIRQDASDAVHAAADAAKEAAPGVTVATSIVDGDAARVLLELGKDAAMIVVGTRRLGSVKGLFLGSVSTSVAAHAHGRVTVVAAEGNPDGPVVVGVDGSPVSDAAVAEAFRQASLRNVPLRAVHTWTPLDADALHGYGIGADEVARMTQDAVEVLAERLAGYAQDYPDVTIERSVLPEEPAKALLDEAGADASLLVVGSRGRGGFRGLLLGSTSQKVMHHADCPVMVVRT